MKKKGGKRQPSPIFRGELSTLKGDLDELQPEITAERGVIRGRLWLWRQVAGSAARLFLRSIYWETIMIKNYFVTTLRGIRRHKLHSFINIFGLAVGLTCSILVALYVGHELSYDRFHKKADSIYRVAQIIHIDDRQDHALPASPLLGETLVKDFPEVEAAVQVDKYSGVLVRQGDRKFEENSVYSSEPAFFDIFSYETVRGDPASALAEPNRVLLTESTAERYFGDSDPMDETLIIEEKEFSVAGIIKDPPDHSHFHFDFITSLCSYERYHDRRWFLGFATVYVVLGQNVRPASLEAKFPAFVDHYYYKGVKPRRSIFKDWELYLQPLTSIHLHSDCDIGEFEPNGNAAYVQVFGVIAVFILIIAAINFVNLSTARAAHREKEVGIRKVVGSHRSQLIGQFLGESILFSLLALGLTAGMIRLLLPAYRSLTGMDLVPRYLDNPMVLLGLLGLTLGVGVLAGIYPALYLSAFPPSRSLKGMTGGSGGRSPLLGRGLVVFQFTISITLLIGTGVVYNQLTYMQNLRLGFDRENVLIVKKLAYLNDQRSFKENLLGHPAVLNAAITSSLPGKGCYKQSCRPEGAPEGIVLEMMDCDDDLKDVLKLEMDQGRFFSRDYPGDDRAIIINQTASRQLGWMEPLGKIIRQNERDLTVIGVVRDFHFESLHSKIKKMGMVLLREKEEFAAVRYRGGDLESVLAHVKRSWDSFSPPVPLEFSFLDTDYADLYSLEKRTRRIAGLFSLLAVFISSLGLFGLAAYTAERRRREIGIRRVLGAEVSTVVMLLTRGYAGSVLAASLIAVPAGYIAMHKWLMGFAYRIDMPPAVFGLAAAAAVIIALLTVAWHSIRAATSDPVISLRCE